MKALLAQLAELWNERAPRERWIAIIAACLVALWMVDAGIVTPFQDRIARGQRRIESAYRSSGEVGSRR